MHQTQCRGRHLLVQPVQVRDPKALLCDEVERARAPHQPHGMALCRQATADVTTHGTRAENDKFHADVVFRCDVFDTVNLVDLLNLLNLLKADSLLNLLKVDSLNNLLKVDSLLKLLKVEYLLNLLKVDSLLNLLKVDPLIKLLKVEYLLKQLRLVHKVLVTLI